MVWNILSKNKHLENNLTLLYEYRVGKQDFALVMCKTVKYN